MSERTKQERDAELASLRRRVTELEAQVAAYERAEQENAPGRDGQADRESPSANLEKIPALQQSRQLQETLYRIADAASAVQEMDDFYRAMHQAVGEFMFAGNFFIALYDEERQMLNFAFIVDENPEEAPDPRLWFKMGRKEARGATAYVLRSGRPLLASRDIYEQMIRSGEIELLGLLPEYWLGVPLKTDQATVGALVVQSYDPGVGYTEDDKNLLVFVAQHVATALERVRLRTQTQERLAELAIINSIGQALSKQLDFQAVIELVGDEIREIFAADTTYIGLYDDQAKSVSAPYYVERGHRHTYPAWPLSSGGLTAQVIESRKPRLFGTVQEWMEAGANVITSPDADEDRNESWLGVPILTGDEVMGVISVQSYQQHAFDEGHVRLLSTIAASMGVALENARLFDETNRLLAETEQRNAELAVINTVQEGLVAEMDIQAIYELVGDTIRDIFDAQAVLINSYDQANQRKSNRYFMEKGERYYPELGEFNELDRRLIDTRQPVLIFENAKREMKKLGMATAPGTEMSKSLIFVPLVIGQEVSGLVSLQNVDREHAFDEDDVRLLTTLANSMSVALENARLFDETSRLLAETEQRNAELAVINSVQEGLVAKMDIQAIYDLVGDTIRDIFDAQVVIISSLDRADQRKSTRYYLEEGERYFPEPGGFNKLDRHLIHTRQPVLISEKVEEEAEKYGLRVTPGTKPPKSLLFVPLVVGQEVNGLVSLQNLDREHAFDEDDLRLLTTLANSMSVALENARLFDETNRLLAETEQRNAELAIINSVGEAMAKQLDVETIARIVGDKVRDIFKAEVTSINLLGPESKMIQGVYEYDRGYLEQSPAFPLGQGLTSRVIHSRQPLIIDSLGQAEEHGAIFSPNAAGDEEQVESYMGVPIIVGESVIGVVDVQSYRPQAFDTGSVRLLSTLAANMGVALENARLFDETNRLLAETEQRNAELAVINIVQEGLVAEMDIQAIYELVGDTIRDIFDAQVVLINSYDRANQRKSNRYLVEKGKRYYPEVGGFHNLDRHLIHTRQPVLIVEDAERETEKLGMQTTPGTETSRSLLFVPLLVGQEVNGCVSLQNVDREHAFNEDDVRLLTTLANSMSVALENARLFDETNRRANEMAALNDIGREISATLELNAVLTKIATRAKDVLNGRDVALRLLQPDGSLPAVVALGKNAAMHEAHVIQIGEGITGNVVQTGTAEMVNDPISDPRMVHTPGTDEEEDEDEAILFAPLTLREAVIGVMAVWREKSAFGPFSESELGFTTGLAGQAAIAIQNARLFDEVQRQKQYSEGLVQNSPVAIVTTDLEGNVVSWNPAAERLFGYSAAEANGQNLDELVAPGRKQEEAHSITHQVASKGRISTVTQRYRQDGSPVDVELLALPVVVEDEQVGFIAIYHDITELQEARKEAEAANEAKSAFLATMSHEIRTPMNAIIGMTGLLLDTDLTQEQVEYSEIIRNSGDALLTIINDILDFSKIEAGRMEMEEQPFDLRDCLETSLDLLKVKATDKGLELAYQVEAQIPAAIIGDVTRLRQILINLLSNAIKFTEVGEVVLTVTEEPETGKKQVPGRHTLHFAVRDTGIGIPPERMNRLFQAFSQVDASTTRKYGGTGLGLVISKRLSELMGGSMWVESEVGQGTTFHFTISAEEAPELKQRPHLQGEQPKLAGKVLLIVDDNHTNRRILTTQVGSWGMRTRDTASPMEALAWIERGDPFDLAILDMHMPEMDGLQLAKAIREQRDEETLPLILFSSISSRENSGEGAIFAAHLQKPLKPSLLFDTLMNIFAGRPGQVTQPERIKSGLDQELSERHPLRILLAEDNMVNQKVALRLLGRMGYRADVAGNGLEAVEALERQTYDVILMDVQMPEMDGLEASRQICSRWPRGERPRIVAMTANATPEDRQKCFEAGMDDYISKPVRVEELVQALVRTQPLETQ